MMRTIILLAAALAMCEASALAACPSGVPDEIFCDDFDSYCQGGGFPGTFECSAGAAGNDTLLQTVWQTTSTDESTATTCGTQFITDSNPIYFLSAPFAGRYPTLTADQLGQQSVSNWNVTPATPGISFLVQSVFGADFGMVQGSDERPLVLQFYLSGVNMPEWERGGGLHRSTGYLELAKGNDRANTDYVLSHYCGLGGGYCNPPIGQGPFPILCANANPWKPIDGACPPVADAPVHNALAVGTMPLLEPDPCYCGVQEHGPVNYHLSLYDGKLWWMLKKGAPVVSTGSLTVDPVNPSAPLPPPDPYGCAQGNCMSEPGDFVLAAGKHGGDGPPNNWVTLTIKANTIDVKLVSRERSSNGFMYNVSSEMHGIPRRYIGCFDQLRGGAGTGCALSSTSWETCASGQRKCIVTKKNNANAVLFDDVILHGGVGCSDRGACCMPSTGACVDRQSEFECNQAGGTFRGENTTCGADDAICKGACCHTASCEDARRITECPSANWRGYGTTCAEPCPCVGHFGDIDADGDVDQSDFSVLQSCFETGTAGGVCVCFDKDNNDVINLDDAADFEACASGPGVPFNPNCDQ